jgi:N-methylhydantoinase B
MRREDNGTVLPPGSVVRVLSAGGGGYGPPADRDPAAARADELDGVTETDGERSR